MKINFRVSLSFFVLISVVLLNSIPTGLAWIGIGSLLCDQTAKRFSCSANASEFARLYRKGFLNITSPAISVTASKGFFQVGLRTFPEIIFSKVRTLLLIASELESDIYLMNTSALLNIVCVTHGSGSQLGLSSNIFSSSVSKSAISHNTRWHPYFSHNIDADVPEDNIQSGYLTCQSSDERKTVRFFTQPEPKLLQDVQYATGSSPFVSATKSRISTDDSGCGFIVPCKTIFRLQTPPDLLWLKDEQGDFEVLTVKNITSLRWDPALGFQFSSSERLWERKTLACRLGPFNLTFLPVANQFSSLYVVRVEGNQIVCKKIYRNDSDSPLVKSNVSLIDKLQFNCIRDLDCVLHWKLGLMADDKRSNPSLDILLEFGLISCVFNHDNHVTERSYSTFFTGLDSKIYLLPGLYPSASFIQISHVNGTFYKSNTELRHEFVCIVVQFIRSTHDPVKFILRYRNKTEVVFEHFVRYHGARISFVAQFDVTLDPNVTHAVCSAFTNKGKLLSAETTLEILDASAPFIENVVPNKVTFRVGDLSDNYTLVCPVRGAPPPDFEWSFSEKVMMLVKETNKRTLVFHRIHEDLAGNYTCRAWNSHGNTSFVFQVSVESQGFFSALSRTTLAWIGFGTIFGVIGLGASMLFAFKYLRTKLQTRNLTEEEALEFLNGIPLSGEPSQDRQVETFELGLNMPFVKRIETTALIVDRDSILGKGHHGTVYRGILHTETVAVKTFKRAVTTDEFRACLIEVKLMQFVGEHPNIVRFLGADVTNIERREILIVMEFSPIGSLDKHLKVLKLSSLTNYVNTTQSQYTTLDGRLTVVKLFGFCEQIAFAMEYLENKNIIHGDLAVRNILVFNHGVVKVTDFGYSRQLYENTTYKPKKIPLIPWRSASIELLRDMEFSTESDIWAFGVTTWEIFTFGTVPFASLRYSDRFVESLEKGMRLSKPSALSESQYAFVRECWNVEKSGRPRFSALKSFFSMETENLRYAVEITQV